MPPNKLEQWVWEPLTKLKPNPNNRNTHPEEQISRLCELLTYQGWRAPITVSNRSGLIVSGHGRLLAAKKLKMDKVPVHYQDFESEEQEYAHAIADNAIQRWAILDFKSINLDLADLGPNLSLDLLGIENFVLDMSEKIDSINRGDESSAWVDMPEFNPGSGYIRLIYIFPSHEIRENFVKDNNITITMKKSDQWIVHLEK